MVRLRWTYLRVNKCFFIQNLIQNNVYCQIIRYGVIYHVLMFSFC